MILIKVVSLYFDPLSTFALVCYPMSLLLAPKWVPLLLGYFCNCNCSSPTCLVRNDFHAVVVVRVGEMFPFDAYKN